MKTKLALTAVLLGVAGLFPTAASAQPVPIVAPGLTVPSYYSPRLKATFMIHPINVGGRTIIAARLVSNPRWDSPLRAAWLRQGDVITRLDGVPVRSFAELERHYGPTSVRFVRQGTTYPQERVVYIGSHYYPGPYAAGPAVLP